MYFFTINKITTIEIRIDKNMVITRVFEKL